MNTPLPNNGVDATSAAVAPPIDNHATTATAATTQNLDGLGPNNENDDLPPLDTMTEYGRPHKPDVTYDKLHLYQPSQLIARRMYSKQSCLPIVLLCMSIGVPSCIPPDDMENDDCYKRALTGGKGGMYTKTQLIPTNKTSGKKYLQKELLRRAILANPPLSSLPQPASHSIKTLVKKLLESPPPEDEYEFIVGVIEFLRDNMHRHFQSHSGTAEASLNRNMHFIEVLMDPSIKQDWLERGMQKNRLVLDAQCGHSEQCETNNHLHSFWDKATVLYNDPKKSYKSRVFTAYGRPYDKSVTIHPVGEDFRIQAESLRKKYTDSRGAVDKLRVNLNASGEGEGSYYGGDEVRSFASTQQDAYMYLVLQDEGQVSDFAQSFDKKHSASSSHTPKTAGSGSSSKKQRQGDTP